MKAEVALSRAGRGDIPEVLELWQGLLAYHSSLDERYQRREDAMARFRETLEKAVGDENYHILVARAGGEAVGYTIGHIAESTVYLAPPLYGHITNIFVLPEWRRQKVGEKLLEAMLAWFREKGLKVFQLRVLAQNNLGKAFWRRHGFSPFAEIWLKV